MSEKEIEYTNGEITIVWKPALCHHAGACVRGLPEVFRPKERPWINAEGADTIQLKRTIAQCPSGALTYKEHQSNTPIFEQENKNTMSVDPITNPIRAQVIANGPIIVHSDISVEKPDGTVEVRQTKASLCRCGASENKPFCDGSHKKIAWQG